MGLAIIAIYHSHPGGTATLSNLDRLFARPGVTQLIIALDEAVQTETLRAYRCGESVIEVPVIVV
jgi:proteasome lid subunit RPN8/RPN11